MSDAASSIQPAESPGDAANRGALSSESIDRILADFRDWLTQLARMPIQGEEPPTVDLHTLVSQFTALRHEINLQTKAARSALEQGGETLVELKSAVEELRERPTSEDDLTPLLKSVVDVYDNLAIALKQVTKQRDAIERPLIDLVEGTKFPEVRKVVESGTSTIRPGFWWRLFGASATHTLRNPELVAALEEIKARHESNAQAAKLVRSSFDGLISGYQMSLNRIDRVLEQFNMETIPTVGESFDPELMEVVEVIGDTGKTGGEVIEEVRRGYIRGEVVFRFAQVKVAR